MGRFAIVLALTSASVWSQPPRCYVPNGSFEQPLAQWSARPGTDTVTDRPHGGERCLRVRPDGRTELISGGASSELAGLQPWHTYSVVGYGRCENVAPAQAEVGYGYMAVYQYDAQGSVIAGGDFGHPTGTQDWQRYTWTFTVYEGASSVRLNCGLWQADGTAWFDDFSVVEGDQPVELADTAPPAQGTGPPGYEPQEKGNIAIFRDEIEVRGAASDPEYLGGLLAKAGYGVAYLDSKQLADRSALSARAFDVVVLPYGESFPSAAAGSLIDFLRADGDLVTLGGYALNHLVGVEAEEDTSPAAPYREVQEAAWHQDIPVEAGRDRAYTFSGCLRTEGVAGSGFGYLAVYQYSATDELVTFKDTVQLKGLNHWQRSEHKFIADPRTTRIHIKVGLFRCTGRAWIDDLSLKDADGNELLTNGSFEEDIAPGAQEPGKWYAGTKDLVTVVPGGRDSARCARCELHYFTPAAFHLNTARGEARDGLNVQPHQIGAFDADFPLKRADHATAADDQWVVPAGFRREGPFTGYAAAAVLGNDDARRIPLMFARDRLGRVRGALGSLVHRYRGYYAGSSWALFGADNKDLFPPGDAEAGRAFLGVVDRLIRETFLHTIETDLACYRAGESVTASVEARNSGREAFAGKVTFACFAEPYGEEPATEPAFTETVALRLDPGASQALEVTWEQPKLDADFYRVRAELATDEGPYDAVETGFVVWSEQELKRCPPLTFHDNFFHYGPRPQFLYGSDTYAFTFNSKHENPLVWRRDLARMRDQGFNVNENLQGHYYEPAQELWRQIDAMIQLSQQHQQIYMAGLLIGANVVVEDAELEKQAAWCARFAERYKDVPGIIYYLNGDFRLQLKDEPDVRRLWNEFLRERYGSDEETRAAWGKHAPAEKLGELPLVNHHGYDWDDLRAVDLDLFRISLLRRWVNRLCEAIRKVDTLHPITSEFYRLPFDGIDLIQGIGEMDHSNIGYFDAPGRDVPRLPSTMMYHDLRSRGKGFGLGEYGVKTHPAWQEGASGYHPTRTEEQADELFLAVHHYGFGLGAGKVQNWCWKDNVERIFPWGLVYPHNEVKRDRLDTHRATALLYHQFDPQYQPPEVFLLTPDSHRLGASRNAIYEATLRAADLLLACSVTFGTLNEYDLLIPKSAKVIFYPAPFQIPDQVYRRLLDWVKLGGVLYVSGDVSYDMQRKRTKTERLAQLCGVDFVAENYPNISVDREAVKQKLKAVVGPDGKPQWLGPIFPPEVSNLTLRVKPAAGERPFTVSDEKDELVFIRRRLGQGQVGFSAWPVELLTSRETHASDRLFYALMLSAAKLDQDAGAPDRASAGLRAMSLPSDRHEMRPLVAQAKRTTVVFNQADEPAGWRVELEDGAALEGKVAPRRGGLCFLGEGDRVLAAGLAGSMERVTAEASEVLLETGGDTLLFTLDGGDLRRSKQLVILPLQPGAVSLRSQADWRDAAAHVGEVVAGRWQTYETLALKPAEGRLNFDVDEDRSRTLIIVCERADLEAVSRRLVRTFTHPHERPW